MSSTLIYRLAQKPSLEASPSLSTMAERTDSVSETEDIKSYRRYVESVFTEHFATLGAFIKEETLKTFAEKAFSKKLILSPAVTDFLGIFNQFKASLTLCRSHLEIRQQYKYFIDIILDLGEPVSKVGKQIEEKLTTGK